MFSAYSTSKLCLFYTNAISISFLNGEFCVDSLKISTSENISASVNDTRAYVIFTSPKLPPSPPTTFFPCNLVAQSVAEQLMIKYGDCRFDSLRVQGLFFFSSLNGLGPNYLLSKFTYRSDVSSYSLRGNNDNLTIPLPHTNFMKNSFSYSEAVLWNSLPIKLRQANSLGAFRAGCKQHF